MVAMYWIAGLLTVGLFFYLLMALLKPELFE